MKKDRMTLMQDVVQQTNGLAMEQALKRAGIPIS